MIPSRLLLLLYDDQPLLAYAIATPGIMRIAATQVYVHGIAEAEVYQHGAAAGEVYVHGATATQVEPT